MLCALLALLGSEVSASKAKINLKAEKAYYEFNALLDENLPYFLAFQEGL